MELYMKRQRVSVKGTRGETSTHAGAPGSDGRNRANTQHLHSKLRLFTRTTCCVFVCWHLEETYDGGVISERPWRTPYGHELLQQSRRAGNMWRKQIQRMNTAAYRARPHNMHVCLSVSVSVCVCALCLVKGMWVCVVFVYEVCVVVSTESVQGNRADSYNHVRERLGSRMRKPPTIWGLIRSNVILQKSICDMCNIHEPAGCGR